MRARVLWSVSILVLLLSPGVASAATVTVDQQTVRLWIPAVGQRDNGTLFGIASDLEVVMQRPGTGRVFVSTQPLTQVDMQGSARLAVDAAAAITGINADSVDFFFTVRTPAVTIGGPSAGGAMAVAVAALLQGWTVRSDVVMTGMINPDGSIGPIGGVLQKLEAADTVGATAFLVPLGQARVPDGQGNVVDAVEVGRDRYGIRVIEVADLYEAIGPFTGQRLVRPTPSTDPLKDAAYADITNRLSQELTSRAQQRSTDLRSRLGNTSLPNGDQTVVRTQLDAGDALLGTAFNSRQQGKHYSAASQAFQALVSYGYAEAVLAFHEQPEAQRDLGRYINDYLATTDAFLATVGRDTQVEYPIAAAQLDSLGASEDRYLEALTLQSQAKQAASQGSRGDTLRLSSFARERGESARWWADIGQEVAQAAGDASVTEAALRSLLDKYFDAATLELEYAALIAGDQPNFQAAQQAFATARAAREQRRLAASLNNLVEAFARTSTALVELSGAEPVRQRLEGLANAAAYEIEIARSQGIPPIFAVSVLELGQSLQETDPVAAYASMLQARISARTSLLAANMQTPRPGVEPFRDRLGVSSQAPAWIALAVAFAAVVFLLVFAILSAEARRSKRAQATATVAEGPSAPVSPPPPVVPLPANGERTPAPWALPQLPPREESNQADASAPTPPPPAPQASAPAPTPPVEAPPEAPAVQEPEPEAAPAKKRPATPRPKKARRAPSRPAASKAPRKPPKE